MANFHSLLYSLMACSYVFGTFVIMFITLCRLLYLFLNFSFLKFNGSLSESLLYSLSSREIFFYLYYFYCYHNCLYYYYLGYYC